MAIIERELPDNAPLLPAYETPVPNATVTLQQAAVPMVRQSSGAVIPARPILNRPGPTQVAWSIDPMNGSVSPLVGAYSAYPHVVYAPQYLGAAGLLDVVSRAVQNNPYAQQAMMLARAGGTGGGGGMGGAGGGRGASSGQTKTQGRTRGDFGGGPILGVNENKIDDGPYPDGMVLTTEPVENIPIDSAANGMYAEPYQTYDPTTGENLMAYGMAGTGALLGAEALRRAATNAGVPSAPVQTGARSTLFDAMTKARRASQGASAAASSKGGMATAMNILRKFGPRALWAAVRRHPFLATAVGLLSTFVPSLAQAAGMQNTPEEDAYYNGLIEYDNDIALPDEVLEQ